MTEEHQPSLPSLQSAGSGRINTFTAARHHPKTANPVGSPSAIGHARAASNAANVSNNNPNTQYATAQAIPPPSQLGRVGLTSSARMSGVSPSSPSVFKRSYAANAAFIPPPGAEGLSNNNNSNGIRSPPMDPSQQQRSAPLSLQSDDIPPPPPPSSSSQQQDFCNSNAEVYNGNQNDNYSYQNDTNGGDMQFSNNYNNNNKRPKQKGNILRMQVSKMGTIRKSKLIYNQETPQLTLDDYLQPFQPPPPASSPPPTGLAPVAPLTMPIPPPPLQMSSMQRPIDFSASPIVAAGHQHRASASGRTMASPAQIKQQQQQMIPPMSPKGPVVVVPASPQQQRAAPPPPPPSIVASSPIVASRRAAQAAAKQQLAQSQSQSQSQSQTSQSQHQSISSMLSTSSPLTTSNDSNSSDTSHDSNVSGGDNGMGGIRQELVFPEEQDAKMVVVKRPVRTTIPVGVSSLGMQSAAVAAMSEYTRDFTVYDHPNARYGVQMNTFGELSSMRKYEPTCEPFAPLRTRAGVVVTEQSGGSGGSSSIGLRRNPSIGDFSDSPAAVAAATAMVAGSGGRAVITTESVAASMAPYIYSKVRLNMRMKEIYYSHKEFEPLFVCVSIYDMMFMSKVSEDCWIQMNDPKLLQAVGLGALTGADSKQLHRAVFAVSGASTSLFFVVKVYRIFHGDIDKDQAAMTKAKADVNQFRTELCNITGTFGGVPPLQPYYWAAVPIYGEGREGVIGTHRVETFMPVKDAVTDAVIFEYIQGFRTMKKTKNPALTVVFEVEENDAPTTSKISPFQIPLVPFDFKKEISKEVRHFSQTVVPYFEYANDIYIYPKHAVLRAPTGHSNIQVSVQFVPEKDIQGGSVGSSSVGAIASGYSNLYKWDSGAETRQPTLSRETFSAVQWDSGHPEFEDEFKLQIPAADISGLAILFTFYNVTIGNKVSRTPIGYAAIPLYENGIVLTSKEYFLPVAKSIPDLTTLYTSGACSHGACAVTTSGSGAAGSGGGGGGMMGTKEMKRSKYYFHLRSHLHSSVLPQDNILGNFLDTVSVGDIASIPVSKRRGVAYMPAASTAEVGMQFLLPVLRSFFRMVVCWDVETGAIAFGKVLDYLEKIFRMPGYQGKEVDNPLLRLYAEVIFDPLLFSGNNGGGGRPIHEALVTAWAEAFRGFAANRFDRVPDSAFTWFFLETISKSIAAYTSGGNSLSTEFQGAAAGLITALLDSIKARSSLYTKANLRAVGFFINGLFPVVADRKGLVALVLEYLSSIDPANHDSIIFNTLKLPLVQALADYEHYVPLNIQVGNAVGGWRGAAALLDAGVQSVTRAFAERYPLAGEIVHEVCSAAAMPTNRITAIKLLRDLLRKHCTDERYKGNADLQAEIATMYFPVILYFMEHPEAIDILDDDDDDPIGSGGGGGGGSEGKHQTEQQRQLCQQRHELVSCVAWITRMCPAQLLRSWWGRDTEKRHTMFFGLLCLCLECLAGQDQLDAFIVAVARICTDFAEDNVATLAVTGSPAFRCIYDCLTTALSLAHDRSIRVTMDAFRTLLALLPQQFFEFGNNAYIDGLCTEVFRAVSDSRYNGTFVKPKDAANFLFSLFEQNYARTGDTLRARTQVVLAISRLVVESGGVGGGSGGSAGSDGSGSGSTGSGSMSSGASSSSNSNSNPGSRKNSSVGYYGTTDFFYDCEIDFDTLLSIVHAVQSKCVPGVTVKEVADGIEEVVSKVSNLLECHRKILSSTDHDALAEYYYQNTVSSAQNPDFRIIWLENLCVKHQETGNFEEAAHCKIFVALLIAKYLITTYHANLSEDDFALLTPNVASVLAQIDVRAAQDSGQFQTAAWNIDALILALRQASECLARAQLYEHCLEVYSVITNILRKEKRYDDLSEILREYTDTCDLIAKKEKERESRMISRFYRVRFFGAALEELNGNQYIYKRPPSVQLADMQTHLRNFLTSKVAGDQTRVVLLPNRPVDESALEHDKVYFQLASVEPYFDSAELEKRNTSYERTFAVRRFIAVQAYTEDGKKSQANDLAEQKEKKTIYDAALAFPFVKSRIEIVYQREIILEPIQHALELIIGRCDKIKEQLENSPPKINPLQQVLQGSVVPMVNEGPVKICEVFLSEDAIKNNPPQDVENLSIAMGNFVELCAAAIQLNRTLILQSHVKFTKMIEKYYKEMYDKIVVYLEKTLSYKPKRLYSKEDLNRKLWREQKKVITDY